jgi:pre-mRNA-splicing factor SPF27
VVLEVLSSAYVSDAYLAVRRANLELLDRGGKNAWLLGNYQLEDELRQLERELAETKREIDVVNLERQRRQEDVKGEMEMLEQTWRTGVGRVLETEVAVEELREQIREEMRRRAG